MDVTRPGGSNASASPIVGWIILCTHVPAFLVFATLFFIRRDVHPIKGRQPILSLFGVITSTMLTVGIALRFINSTAFPCWLVVFWLIMWIHGTGFAYIFRSVMLYFHFSATHERLLHPTLSFSRASLLSAAKSNKPGPEQMWFCTHLHLISRSYMLLWFVISTSVVSLVPLVIVIRTADDEFCGTYLLFNTYLLHILDI